MIGIVLGLITLFLIISQGIWFHPKYRDKVATRRIHCRATGISAAVIALYYVYLLFPMPENTWVLAGHLFCVATWSGVAVINLILEK